MARGAWQAIVHGIAESDTTESAFIPAGTQADVQTNTHTHFLPQVFPLFSFSEFFFLKHKVEIIKPTQVVVKN